MLHFKTKTREREEQGRERKGKGRDGRSRQERNGKGRGYGYDNTCCSYLDVRTSPLERSLCPTTQSKGGNAGLNALGIVFTGKGLAYDPPCNAYTASLARPYNSCTGSRVDHSKREARQRNTKERKEKGRERELKGRDTPSPRSREEKDRRSLAHAWMGAKHPWNAAFTSESTPRAASLL